MTFTLRPARLDDAPAIAALHAANWRSAYANVLRPEYLAGPIDADRLSVWRGRLSKPAPNQRVTLAEGRDGDLLGFACSYLAHDARWGGFLDNLHTSQAARGMGVGKSLLCAAAAQAVSEGGTGLYLWVFEKNLPARGFYAHMGGQEIECLPSDDPNAVGKNCWRIHWSDAADLAGRA